MPVPPASGSPYTYAPQTPPGPCTTPAPAYAAVQPTAVPGLKGRKGPLTLIIIGAVLLVVAAVVLLASIASVSRASGPLTQIQSNGSVTAELETGSVYGLYSDGQASACTVADPQGAELPLIEVHSAIRFNDHDIFATFIPTVSGSYTVTCTASSASPIFLGEATNATELARLTLSAIGSGLGGTLGAGLLIGGLVWLLVRRSRNRRVLQATAPLYPQPGYPQSVPQPGTAPGTSGQWTQP